MAKKKSKLKIAQENAEAAIGRTNEKINELGIHTGSLYDSLTAIQDLFDEIRNVPTEKKLQYEELKNVRLNWKQQAEKIASDYKNSVAKNARGGAAGVGVGVAVAVGAAVAQGSDGVVAGLTSINGSKKLANTMFAEDGSALLKYFVLDNEGVADKYNIAFPKGSELVALVDGAIQEMIDSGEMEKLVQYWLY